MYKTCITDLELSTTILTDGCHNDDVIQLGPLCSQSLFQFVQTELTKFATDRGRLIAEKERMAEELSVFKSQQQIPVNMQAQPTPRKETRFYQFFHRNNTIESDLHTMLLVI